MNDAILSYLATMKRQNEPVTGGGYAVASYAEHFFSAKKENPVSAVGVEQKTDCTRPNPCYSEEIPFSFCKLTDAEFQESLVSEFYRSFYRQSEFEDKS